MPPSRGSAPSSLRTAVVALAVVGALAMLGSMVTGCSRGSDGARGLAVRDATIDEPINGQTAAVRMVIDNRTGTNDRLIRVRTPAAERATLHRTASGAGGLSTMESLDAVDIPAGKEVAFAPGGLHVMLAGLERQLAIGDAVRLTLTFEKAGDRVVRAEVVPIGSNGAGGDGDLEGGHDMSEMGG